VIFSATIRLKDGKIAMKYNLWGSFGRLVVISVFLFLADSEIKAQPKVCDNKKADKLLQQGSAEYDKKNYQQAIVFYDQAVKAASKCPAPYYNKGLALLDADRFEESIMAFQEALKRNFAESFRAHHWICVNRYNQKKYDEAIKSCEESIRLNGNFFWSNYHLAYSLMALDSPEKALIAVRRATELDPKYVETLILKARLLNNFKKYDEAIADLKAVVNLDPKNDEAQLILGANYYLLKDYTKAIEHLTQTLKLNPNSFVGWYLLASAYVGASQNWEKSEEAALQAVRLQPDSGDAHFQLGLAQMNTGKLEAAVKSFEAALKNKCPFPAAASVYKGFSLAVLQRTAEAEKSFEQALSYKPTNKVEYLATSEIYFYRWELDKARAELKKGIEFAPDDNDGVEYALMSWSYSLSHDPQSAIMAANEAIQQDPKAYDGYSNRCRSFNETNLPDIAIKDCQKVLEILPSSGEAYFYLGRAYALKKEPAQEKSNNKKAISLMEKRLNIFFNPQTGQIENIPANLQFASSERGKVSINSLVYSYYLYLLGNAYFHDNNYDAAIATYKKVAEIRPRFPRLRFNLAVSYLNLKKADAKNAELQYSALQELDKKFSLSAADKKLMTDLRKILNGYKRKK
jgi:tetratricopeptide (TPR) repeat protein